VEQGVTVGVPGEKRKDVNALVERGPQGPVNAVLQVQFAAPPDHVREQVAVEG